MLAVRGRSGQVVTRALLTELAHFIYELGVQGVTLGAVLRLAAVHRGDDEHELSVQTFQNPRNLTVAQYFGMGTTEKPSNRGYYDANIPALIQQSAASSHFLTGNNRCTRCINASGKANLQFGGRCSQTYYRHTLLNWGACNECQMNGNHASCSFYRKCLLSSLFLFSINSRDR